MGFAVVFDDFESPFSNVDLCRFVIQPRCRRKAIAFVGSSFVRTCEATVSPGGWDCADEVLCDEPCPGAYGKGRAESQGISTFGAVTDSEAGRVCPCVPDDEWEDSGSCVDVEAHAGDAFYRPETTCAPDDTDAERG